MLDRRSFIKSVAAAGLAVSGIASTAFAGEAPAGMGDMPGMPAEGMPGGGMPGGFGGFGAAAEPGAMDTVPFDYEPGVGEYPLGVPAGTPAGLDWMNIPEPITDIADEKTADVVVIGAGIAGLTAARAALEAGASVIVLEASTSWQARGLDLGVFNAQNQIEVGFETSEEDMNGICLEMQRYSGNRANQAIMRNWIHRCGEDFDWWFKELLEPKGYTVSVARWPLEVPYDPIDGEWFPQFIAANEIAGGGAGGGFGGVSSAVGEIGNWDMENGAEFVFETRARQLVRGEDNKHGRVTAVIAENPDGSYTKYTAQKGIVLATGDYGKNDAMMRAWCPSQADLAARSMLPWATSQGDGHLMGMWVGGMMQSLPHPYMAHASAGDFGTFPSLYVDINGRRFTNEDIPGQTFADTIDEVPCKVWWQLADAQYPNQLKWSQPGHGAVMSFSGDIDTWNAAIETGDQATIEAMMAEQGITYKHAWTIEELAQAISVDPAVLQATVDRYNELCEAGYDADFGKQPKRLFPLSTPPYFYSTNTWNFLVMTGGLKSSVNAEVLDRFGNPIPGLYVCGNAQGGRFAYNYPTIIPGVSHSMCLTYGRIAGTNAATNDPSITEYVSLFKEGRAAKAEADAAEAEQIAETQAAVMYKDGTYEASGKGIGGKVPLTVVIEGGKIVSVEVGDNGETQGIGSKAIEQMPAKIVEANGIEGVDGVSGASVTSKAIFTAMSDILEQAAL
ncbi:MAG: FAD-dependent oxidoreductase [Coriobacteriales bacterium]|nr:FAD-dependent oxidoreductase [Coriobacteriales bacterium]